MMVFADAASDDDSAAIEKREAPMAEPSTDYTPPRLEAPYATYSPLLANENAPQAAYYQSTTFNNGPTTPSDSPAYEYNRYVGVIPLPPVDGNDLGNGLKPGPPYNNAPYGLTPPAFDGNPGRNPYEINIINNNNNNNGFGRNNNNNNNGNGNGNGDGFGRNGPYDTFAKYGGQNTQGQYATSYAQMNGLGPSLSVYGENGHGNKNNNNPGFYAGQPPSNIKGPYNNPSPFSNNPGSFNSPGSFNNNPGSFNSPGSFNNPNSFNNPSPFNGASGPTNYLDNQFYGNPLSDAKYPSTSALVSNDPQFGPGGKGYNQPQPQPLNTQALKNSRPAALIPPHLQRKPPSFLNDQKQNPNFRPSFLLGSSVLSSTPDYDQPTLTSLGELNQFLQQQNIQLIPNGQYAPAINMGNLPLVQRDYLPAPPQPQFLNGYQSPDNFGGQIPQQTPVTSYGEALPDTIIYTKSSLYSERYGQGAPT